MWSCYKSIRTPCSSTGKKDPLWLVVTDTLLSYVFLPWPVVGFWRGFWYLMDEYLYGFGDERDLWFSMLYSTVLGLGLIFVFSEEFSQYLPASPDDLKRFTCNRIMNEFAGRLRTLILAIGAVNFWRAVWLTWDEFMGKTSTWSAAVRSYAFAWTFSVLSDVLTLSVFLSPFQIDGSFRTFSGSLGCSLWVARPVLWLRPRPSVSMYLS